MEKSVYEKIIQKKEFSNLPKKDVELAFSQFERRQTSDEDKIKLTRDLLRKVFSVFGSEKLLTGKKINPEFVLKKHISTRERLEDYNNIYSRIFSLEFSSPPTHPFAPSAQILSRRRSLSHSPSFGTNFSVIDLGCGVNGFSFNFMKKFGVKSYIGVEAMGQLVDLTNKYFESEKILGKVFHESLFELEKIKKIITEWGSFTKRTYNGRKSKNAKIIFLFKTLDSLEMLERDYSKKLLKEIVPLADKVVVSFATRSLVARTKFFAKRNWIIDFIKENFSVIDEFETDGEKYLVLSTQRN